MLFWSQINMCRLENNITVIRVKYFGGEMCNKVHPSLDFKWTFCSATTASNVLNEGMNQRFFQPTNEQTNWPHGHFKTWNMHWFTLYFRVYFFMLISTGTNKRWDPLTGDYLTNQVNVKRIEQTDVCRVFGLGGIEAKYQQLASSGGSL